MPFFSLALRFLLSREIQDRLYRTASAKQQRIPSTGAVCYTILLCPPHRELDTYVIEMISHCGWRLVANTRASPRTCARSSHASMRTRRQKRTPCPKSALYPAAESLFVSVHARWTGRSIGIMLKIARISAITKSNARDSNEIEEY